MSFRVSRIFFFKGEKEVIGPGGKCTTCGSFRSSRSANDIAKMHSSCRSYFYPTHKSTENRGNGGTCLSPRIYLAAFLLLLLLLLPTLFPLKTCSKINSRHPDETDTHARGQYLRKVPFPPSNFVAKFHGEES